MMWLLFIEIFRWVRKFWLLIKYRFLKRVVSLRFKIRLVVYYFLIVCFFLFRGEGGGCV